MELHNEALKPCTSPRGAQAGRNGQGDRSGGGPGGFLFLF
jgi:hypothetical protein